MIINIIDIKKAIIPCEIINEGRTLYKRNSGFLINPKFVSLIKCLGDKPKIRFLNPTTPFIRNVVRHFRTDPKRTENKKHYEKH